MTTTSSGGAGTDSRGGPTRHVCLPAERGERRGRSLPHLPWVLLVVLMLGLVLLHLDRSRREHARLERERQRAEQSFDRLATQFEGLLEGLAGRLERIEDDWWRAQSAVRSADMPAMEFLLHQRDLEARLQRAEHVASDLERLNGQLDDLAARLGERPADEPRRQLEERLFGQLEVARDAKEFALVQIGVALDRRRDLARAEAMAEAGRSAPLDATPEPSSVAAGAVASPPMPVLVNAAPDPGRVVEAPARGLGSGSHAGAAYADAVVKESIEALRNLRKNPQAPTVVENTWVAWPWPLTVPTRIQTVPNGWLYNSRGFGPRVLRRGVWRTESVPVVYAPSLQPWSYGAGISPRFACEPFSRRLTTPVALLPAAGHGLW